MVGDIAIDSILAVVEKHIKEAQQPYANHDQLKRDLAWLNKWHTTSKPSRIKRLKKAIEKTLAPF